MRSTAVRITISRLRVAAFIGMLLLSGIGEAREPTPTEPTAESNLSAADLRGKATALEADMLRLQPESEPALVSGRSAILLQDSLLGVSNFHSDDAVRFFATRLTIANTGPAPLKIDAASIVLRSGQKTLRWQDRPADLEGAVLTIPGGRLPVREARPPDAFEVPPGEVRSEWILFGGLDTGPFVPDLALHVPLEGAVREIPVNLYEQAQLRLEAERMGPHNCLALMTIRGTLNTINAGTLADEIAALAPQRVARLALIWPEGAPQPEEQVRSWLMQAQHPGQVREIPRQFRQMPVLPSTVSELHVAGLQGASDRSALLNFHDTAEEAVDAALATAMEALSSEEAVAAVRGGHRLVRLAALRHASDRLPPEKVDLVLELSQGSDAELQSRALTALGSFDSEAAHERLLQAARGGDAKAAAAAVEALASSRHAAAHRLLASALTDKLSVPDPLLIEILSRFPRPDWREFVFEKTAATEPAVRRAALRALSRLGHPELLQRLADGLKSPDAGVRQEAFGQLVQRDERESDELALEYALDHLRSHPPEPLMQPFLRRIRDPRVAPLLESQLDREQARGSVIQLLSELGNESSARAIADRYSDLNDGEKAAALQALRTLDSPRGQPLALQALRSSDQNLVNNAVQLLQSVEDPDVVAEMASVLETSKERNTIYRISMALGAIATPEARAALLKNRNSENEFVQRYARDGLRVLWQQSPANLPVNVASAMLEAGKLDEASQQLAVAREYDPEHPPTFLALAELELQRAARAAQSQEADPEAQQQRLAARKQHIDAAVEHYRSALKIDDKYLDAASQLGDLLYKEDRHAEAIPPLELVVELNPADHQSLSTLAIASVITGKVEKGVQLARDGLKRFEQQSVYLYNVACVYGRAVGQLREARQHGSGAPAEAEREAEYAREAVKLLEQSLRLGVEAATAEPDMHAYMRQDPDLQALHDDPAFRKVARFDGESETAEPPAEAPQPPPRNARPADRNRPAPIPVPRGVNQPL